MATQSKVIRSLFEPCDTASPLIERYVAHIACSMTYKVGDTEHKCTCRCHK